MNAWKIWVDTGGTFTDCLAIDPHQRMHRLKVLSSGVLRGRISRQPSRTQLYTQLIWPVAPDIYSGYQLDVLGTKAKSYTIQTVDTSTGLITVTQPVPGNLVNCNFEVHTGEEVPVFAARLLTQTPIGRRFPAIDMKLGSTRGTNAILERKGARTALLVTKGFKDLLLIGNQQRPHLFALHIEKQLPLYDEVFEVSERVDASGAVLLELSSGHLNVITEWLAKKKVESVAIAFLNSYRNPVHEQLLKAKLLESGFAFVSASHELSGQIKILPRAETAVANAYLAPIIHRYLTNIRQGLEGASLKVMSSAGSLIDIQSYHPKDSLLSGPAGGVVGAATTAQLSGFSKIIAFDMGGTSTDVSLYDSRFDYRYESQVGALKILSPSLAIETIAAGGGSICSFDGFRFTVGPESAGAKPGPACYGAGGPLTITDVNLLLGRIDPDQFAMPLSIEKAEVALQTLLTVAKKSTRKKYTRSEVLRSLLQIANEKMAEAIKKVSTQVGHNPLDFALLSFGGAGGQHACALASLLGMTQIVVPYDAGLLSAYGIGHARVERFSEALILASLHETYSSLAVHVQELLSKGKNALLAEDYSPSQVVHDKTLAFLRFRGQESVIEVPFSPHQGLHEIVATFRKQYESIYGHWLEHRDIEIESLRVVVCVAEAGPLSSQENVAAHQPLAQKKSKGFSIYRWEDLTAGARINGPALVVSGNSTTVVDLSWELFLDPNNNAIITQTRRTMKGSRHTQEAELELFTNRFTAVAREMGALLQRTSFSVNVKERLDFSCALLDAEGYLVVNAPHIPVHLGSLGVCVREVLKRIAINEGDVVITNHPAYGGSHLPDVTLIKAVFVKGKRIGFVVNRAHHAEIGGAKPGSMPAHATALEEEGVIIPPMYLVHQGEARWNTIEACFKGAKFPTRQWDENQADLNGALAAVHYGDSALQALCVRHGDRQVQKFMRLLRAHASRLVLQKLVGLPARTFKAIEKLDDGAVLKVKIQKHRGRLLIDFSGSAPTHAGNLNATKAIVQSVVLYVLRLLVNQSVPMNEGLLEPVKLILQHGLLNPNFEKVLPAVVGGNTEVSQRLTDTLLKALGLAACSQGTMNNFLFGNEQFGYYETICGGTGAGRGFNGTSAVHQHMTNTRITDPELLEHRYPVRLEKFEVRRNSGGKGKWKGGDGVVRQFFFCDTLEVNILSQHRMEKPYGLQGGLPGKCGVQRLVRANGKIEKLKGVASATVEPGDRLIIETPGGGGFGQLP